MIKNSDITVEEQERILTEKLNKRTANIILADDNTEGRDENRQVMLELCKDPEKGFQFFCDQWGWLENPQAEDSANKDVPFLLYKFQEEAAKEIIKAIREGYDLPIEKSRKMGMSWLMVHIIVWGWMFFKWDCLVGSQTADKVDKKGDIGALMEKARYLIERLPNWMIRPLNDKESKYKLLLHPDHRARISGESNTVKFGRSDRHKVVLFDEFSSWECTDKAAWTACGSTAECRIPLSTPNQRGINCFFYQIIKDAKKKGRPFLSLHWTLNPVFAKNSYIDEEGKTRSPWYNKECDRAVSVTEVAQELDINYEASMSGKVFSEFNLEQVQDNIEYDPNLPLYVGWDWGLDGTALIWFQPDEDNNVIYVIDEYQNNGKGAGADIVHYIDVIESKGYKAAIHFGDPYSGENRQLAARGNSNAGVMRKFGLVVKTERGKKESRIAAGRNLLFKMIFSSKCVLTIEMMVSWQLEQSGIPKHDEFSHLGDGYTYFCFNYKNGRDRRKQQPTQRRKFSHTTGGSVL